MKAPKYVLKVLSICGLLLLAVFTAWSGAEKESDPPGFSLRASPQVRTVDAGDATHYNVVVQFRGEYWDRVHFSLDGLPDDAGTAVFEPRSVENPSMGSGGGAAEAKLGIETLASAPAGEYTLTVHGTNESGHETAEVLLIIREKETDFTLKAEPAVRTVKQGDETRFDVQVALVNFVHPIRLEVSGLPAGIEAEFDAEADTLGPDQRKTRLNIRTGPETPAGEYTLKITGTAENKRKETSVILIVEELEIIEEEDDFSLSASPQTRQVVQGESAAFDLRIEYLNGFDDSVFTTVSGLPRFGRGIFTPNPFEETGNGSLTVQTDSQTPPGEYTLVVSATGGDIRKETALVVIVKEKGDFSLDIAPDRRSVLPGSTAAYTVGIRFSEAFSDAVELTVESLPKGLEGILNPGNVTEPGEAELSVSVDASVEPGNYSLAITGTGGTLTRSCTAVLIVERPESDFTLAATPAVITVNPGESAKADVAVSFIGVCQGPAGLSLSGIPETWSAALASLSLAPNRPETVLEINTECKHGAQRNFCVPGDYAITIHGNGCGLSRSATVIVRIKAATALAISKTQSAPTLVPGQEHEYQLKIVNTGNSAASGIIVYDELDGHLTYKNDTSGGAVHEVEGRKHQWTFPEPLEPGGRIEFAIRAKVSENIRAETVIENTAQAACDLLPGPVSSDTVRATAAYVPVRSNDLVVTKRVNRRNAKPGTILVYTVRIENKSGGTIFDLSLEDRLPNGFLLVEGKTRLDGKPSADPDGRRRLLWNLGNLPAGGSTTLKYQVVVGTNARRGRNTNRAVARGVDGSGKKIKAESEVAVSLGVAEMEISGEIKVYAFADSDGNGIFGANENGIQGITIILSNGDKRLTGENGEALFEDVRPGRYVVAIDERELPGGARASEDSSKLVSVQESEEAEIEFPVIRAGGETGQIDIFIYLDRNQNLVFDGDDSPMPAIPVGLSTGETMATDKTGHALFAEVSLGETEAFPDTGLFPAFIRILGEPSQTVNVLGGEKLEVAFPAVWHHKYARLAGRVFFDKNKNGSYDEDKDFLAEKFIAHLECENCFSRPECENCFSRLECENCSSRLHSKRTHGQNGAFIFTRLEPGGHTLDIDAGGGRRVTKQIELTAGRNQIDIPLEYRGVKVIVGVSQ